MKNKYIPQNLLPKKFDLLLGVHQGIKWIKYMSVGFLAVTFAILVMSLVVNVITVVENRGVVEIQSAKAKYDLAVEDLNRNKEAYTVNTDRLNYVNSLQTEYTTFHDLLLYLEVNKPTEVTILSMEDSSLVPPPDMTAEVIEHASVSELLNPNKKTVSTQDPVPESAKEVVEGEEISTNINEVKTAEEAGKAEEPTEGEPSETAPSEPPATTPEESTGAPEYKRYQSTLQYTRDIATSSIVLRGYANNVTFVSSYISSISRSPEVKGFTIEGIESKNTSLPGTDVVLFEIKIDLKAVEV